MYKHYLTILYTFFCFSLLACSAPAPREEAAAPTPGGDKFYIGSYSGNFYGEDTGSLQVEIDARDALIWEGVSQIHGGFTVTGVITYTDAKWMIKGEANNGRTFMGFVESTGEFSGTWEDTISGERGMFSLRKQ